jgi:hypothetical protein
MNVVAQRHAISPKGDLLFAGDAGHAPLKRAPSPRANRYFGERPNGDAVNRGDEAREAVDFTEYWQRHIAD